MIHIEPEVRDGRVYFDLSVEVFDFMGIDPRRGLRIEKDGGGIRMSGAPASEEPPGVDDPFADFEVGTEKTYGGHSPAYEVRVGPSDLHGKVLLVTVRHKNQALRNRLLANGRSLPRTLLHGVKSHRGSHITARNHLASVIDDFQPFFRKRAVRFIDG